MSKEILIEDIKNLINISKDDSLEINPNYLNYFEEEELVKIKKKLTYKRENINQENAQFLDELYNNTKKD